MTQGVGSARALRDELLASGGTAKTFAEAMESGLGGSLRSLNAAFEGFAIELGEVLAPVVQKLAGYIKSLVNRFKELSPNYKENHSSSSGIISRSRAVIDCFGWYCINITCNINRISRFDGSCRFSNCGYCSLNSGDSCKLGYR